MPDTLFPITAAGLVFQAQERRLVDVDNLQIMPGGPTVILGPNGAGKSLLLRLLHGLIEPTQGQVRFAGRPLTPDIQSRQAMVFQKPVLLRRSVAENIAYVLKIKGLGRTARRAEVQRWLSESGFDQQATQAARSLSGGEQQRLAIIRALASDPEILFLDEPTASLDPDATEIIEDLIRSVSDQGVKIILVTHDLGQARRLAQDVIFCARGQVCEHSAASEFFDHPKSAPAQSFVAGRLA